MFLRASTLTSTGAHMRSTLGSFTGPCRFSSGILQGVYAGALLQPTLDFLRGQTCGLSYPRRTQHLKSLPGFISILWPFLNVDTQKSPLPPCQHLPFFKLSLSPLLFSQPLVMVTTLLLLAKVSWNLPCARPLLMTALLSMC